MKKVFYIVLIALVSINANYGQQVLEGQGQNTTRGSSGFMSTTPVVINKTVDGTPYINEKFLPAKISASPDNIFYVRYNAVKDEIEVKGQNNIAYALNKYRRDIKVELMTLKTTYQVYEYLDVNKNSALGYFIEVNNDKNALLLKKERISFVGERTSTTGYDAAKSAYFKRGRDKFYVKLNNAKAAVEIPKNKKAAAKLFSKNSAKVLAFIKENKLKTTNEKDLVKLINYANTI